MSVDCSQTTSDFLDLTYSLLLLHTHYYTTTYMVGKMYIFIQLCIRLKLCQMRLCLIVLSRLFSDVSLLLYYLSAHYQKLISIPPQTQIKRLQAIQYQYFFLQQSWQFPRIMNWVWFPEVKGVVKNVKYIYISCKHQIPWSFQNKSTISVAPAKWAPRLRQVYQTAALGRGDEREVWSTG